MRSTSLARFDGVEFALILPGCGLGEAVEVLDRVRGATPRGQTASAGVARWDGEEPAELLMLRAQDALSAAKSSGRNVTDPRRIGSAGLRKSARRVVVGFRPSIEHSRVLSPLGGRNGGPNRSWSDRWGESLPLWRRSAGLREPDS